MIKRIIKKSYKFLPNELRSRIGINKNQLASKTLASTSKRLDLCSAQIALLLHSSNFANKFPLRDKVCVELGSGWVLSHSLVFHLLGAKRVIATDLQTLANPTNLYQSINSSTISVIRDILSPFEEHSIIRARLNKLLAIKTFTFDVLQELGIEYVAPIDLAIRPLNTKIGFVFSCSVLEHVPIDDILPLLQNLESALCDGGVMIHCIHLEDHKDFVKSPFDFFSESSEKYNRDVQSSRGNRIRLSQWNDIFSHIKNIEHKFIYQWSRLDKKLPIIDPSIQYLDVEDLKISHIGILCKKKKKT